MSVRMSITATFAASLFLSALPVSAQEQGEASAAQPAAAAPPKQAQPLPSTNELRQRASQAYRDGDATALRQAAGLLHQMRPYNDEYMSWLVVGAAMAGDRSAAYEMMLQMQQQGLARDFDAVEVTASIRGTQVYDHVNGLLKKAAEPAGDAEPLMTLPEDLLLPTAIAWDESREAWLVSDARKGAVYQVNGNGEADTLVAANADNRLQGIYSLLVDEEANRLWVTSNPTRTLEGFDAEKAHPAEIVEFTLDELEIVARYSVPVDKSPRRLGGMVRTPDGDIYAADSVLPVIYRLSPGDDALTSFLAARGLVSQRGIALSDDGRKLYVADYEMGLMGLDLVERKAFRVEAPANLNLGGIEGLFFRNGHLVVIQNGISPQRIMRLKLSDDGTSIVEVAPLAVALEMFNMPDFGTVKGEDLVFFANSHWVPNAREQGPVQVARVNIDEAPALVSPDMDEFLQNYQAEQPAE